MIVIHYGVIDDAMVQGGMEVRDSRDYVEARRAIRDAAGSQRPLDVFILDRTCDRWFWDLDGHSVIQFVNEDPVELLREKLGVQALPSYLTAAVIRNLRLLEKPDSESPIRDVTWWVAQTELGEVWGEEKPSLAHLSALVSWWADSASRNLSPTLLRVVSLRLQHWSSSAKGDALAVYQALQDSPIQVVLFFCAYQALSSYDAALRKGWLQEKGWFVSDLEPAASKMSDLPVPPDVDKALSVFAEAYWGRRLRDAYQGAIDAS